MLVEQRKFKMHEKLLLDVIKKQAGTIQKAILEGVMNSIEAGATRVEVDITAETVSINDDGKGFKSRGEVETFFETFGEPHSASEGKVWAQFRMGRGQMFAFGKNIWRTGRFQMSTDINQRLGYDLTEDHPEYKGCLITIALYDKLTDRDIYGICREAESFCKYVKVPIKVNGKTVNTDPAKAKWEKETDEAYIKLSEKSDLKVYNLGVFVCGLPSHNFGIGGTVVSKKRLDVNFARNDVTRSCPVWKAIRTTIESMAGIQRIKKKKTLNTCERSNAIMRLCAGELSYQDVHAMPLMVDVSGTAWSAQKAVRKFKKYSVAMAGDMKGDKLIQQGVALVLDENNVAEFDCKAEELFSAQWGYTDVKHNPAYEGETSFCYHGMQYVPFEKLAESLKDSHDILLDTQLTPTEALWIRAIESLQSGLVNTDERRVIKIGVSDTAEAWTDGRTFVAFNRRHLADMALKKDGRLHIGSLGKAALVLAHELAHDDDSTTNVHGEEFYKKFHDLSIGNNWMGVGTAVYRTHLELQGEKLEKAENAAAERVRKKNTKTAQVPELVAG